MKQAKILDGMTDEEMFSLVQHNNEQAFEALYARYERRLFAYCLAVMKEREAAEDIFQTTMMNVFKNRHSFKGGNFEAWFFTIARNNCLKAKRNVLQTNSIDTYTESIANPGDRTGDDILFREAFNKALAKLPEEFRQPIELKYMGGFSYDEIARMLDISLSLVKVRIFRAKKMLKHNLQPYLEES